MEKTLIADGFRGGNHQFVTRSWKTLALSYSNLYHPDQPDTEIFEKMQNAMEKIGDPFYTMVVLDEHWKRYSFPQFSTAPGRQEAFEQALKAILNDAQSGQRVMRLGWMLGRTNKEENDQLLDAMLIFSASPNVKEIEQRQIREHIDRARTRQENFATKKL